MITYNRYTGFTWGDLLEHTLLDFDPEETKGAVYCAVRHDPGYDPGMCTEGRPFKARSYPPLLTQGSARLAEPVPMFEDTNPTAMDPAITTLSVFDAVLCVIITARLLVRRCPVRGTTVQHAFLCASLAGA